MVARIVSSCELMENAAVSYIMYIRGAAELSRMFHKVEIAPRIHIMHEPLSGQPVRAADRCRTARAVSL